MSTQQNLNLLNQKITQCTRCPRLIQYCKQVATEKRRAFENQTYWGRPVPNFGDPQAKILIVGLAPAAHGANRTGRMFTGDRSGLWLYRALYRAGLANQARSEELTDGLKLKNCFITSVVHCAPPDNKPTSKEIFNCQKFLKTTFNLLKPQYVVALGAIAWNAIYSYYRSQNLSPIPRPRFFHNARWKTLDNTTIIGSYHPSQQNTFTGRLTEEMLDSIFSSCTDT